MKTNAVRKTVTDNFPQPAEAQTLRELTRVQWNAFFAAFFGWLLDGFDFSILTFLLIDIAHSFTVDKALAGALGTVTLLFRLLGGVGSGTIADRYGRKTPLMLSILWISLFSLLSGFSVSYAMLFACRAFFGIGMGGVWASGLPLALEHWPTRLRGIASGLLMGGFNWGYMFAAIVFQLGFPLVNAHLHEGWRAMFWIAAVPGFVVFWIRRNVQESPVYLDRRRTLGEVKRQQEGLSIVQIFKGDLFTATLQTTLVMTAFMFSYYSISFWYPTYLRESGLRPLEFLVLLNVGGIIGTAFWGRLSETKLGRRSAISLAALGGVSAIPLYISHTVAGLLAGALLMGICGIGAWGMAPSYLTERFPTRARAVGPGFSYHAGAAIGSITPTFIGYLQDHAVKLGTAMSMSIAAAGLFVAVIIWLGPETRGQSFTA